MISLKTQYHFTQVAPRKWATVGSSGNVYTLQLGHGSLQCSCKAAKHGKRCTHTDQLASYFKAEINDLIAPTHISA